MKFIHEDFLLETRSARRLYHQFAETEPILDYHCHLSPRDIAGNRQFNDLFEIWLEGDHYKWRAMRFNGVAERYCTGDAKPFEKFQAWAATVPHTVRNPLYHWTHLELKRYFGIDELLDEESAARIWKKANQQLATPELTAQGILKSFNVTLLCTTDDPVDDLQHHESIAGSTLATRVLPAFRPDSALAVHDPGHFNDWVRRLEQAADVDIGDFASFLEALSLRHDYFHAHGCRLSDHGLDQCYADFCSMKTAAAIFARARRGRAVSPGEQSRFAAFMMLFFGRLDSDKGWTKQLHLGALRDNNQRRFRELGPNTGFDSISDLPQAAALAAYLGALDREQALPKTIIYNSNPGDNYVFATMIGNFQDGTMPGKIQLGSGWWFLDQREGMEWQLNALSNHGLLSRFVGMVTDSRSFMSYPRHEYFRRVLCNLIGRDVEAGEIPDDEMLLGPMIRNICYGNAQRYLALPADDAPGETCKQTAARPNGQSAVKRPSRNRKIDAQSDRGLLLRMRRACLLLHPMITKATMQMKTNTCLPRRHAPGERLWPAVLLLSCVPLALALNLAACAADSSSPSAPTPARTFDVRQFGAQGDGKTVDTAAVQKALDECGKAGGGTVRFPAGTYLSQPISLRSRTILLLDQGATLKATDDPKDYLPSNVTWEDILQGRSKGPFVNFVNGKKLVDVTITGQGTIDGSGARWWAPAEEARRKVSGYTLPRPNLIRITGCRGLNVTDVTLQNSPKFHLVPDDCEDVLIEHVTILAPEGAANTDAIDPTMSRRVTITKCLIDVGDDNVAIKSGKKMPGREFACEDLTITDCIFKHGHGLSIGSETAGGVRNLTVKRCRFEDTQNGIRIKSPRGKGGKVENLIYEDITMTNVEGAITFTCYYPKIPKTDTAQAVTPETPSFRNIRIRNLTATSTFAAGVIIGLPESPVSNVVLENVQITAATTGLAIRNAKGIQLKTVQVTAKEGPPFVVEDAQVQGLGGASQR